MDTLNIMNTLKAILIDLGVAEELLHESTYLQSNLQIDSMEIVEIALGLKRKLGVNLKLQSRHDITLSELCNLVAASMAANTR
ncbi:acyl carrier protein [Chlorogloeopsis sp. ULAP02]|uniref:acyl carrier protein n=1 Tax=Chlorogloeopsis sp. ULAP02 TaxID=3107926 RepID=UPI00313616DE